VRLRVVRCDAYTSWQLQHGRQLAFAQLRQQDDLAVGELKGVTMDVGPTLVDLLEFRHPVPESPGEDKASLESHLLLEGKLGAGEQTNGHITIIDRSKTTRSRVGEARRYQLVSDLRGPGRD
jgi:hypothetical protein